MGQISAHLKENFVKKIMVISIPNKLATVQIVQLEAGSRVKEINTGILYLA